MPINKICFINRLSIKKYKKNSNINLFDNFYNQTYYILQLFDKKCIYEQHHFNKNLDNL